MDAENEMPADRSAVGENLCPDCSGSGTSDQGTCTTCGGSGTVVEPIGGA